MAYFLALDVGGTKTDYVLADDAAVLARTRSGSIKRMRMGANEAEAYLEAALAELTAQSGVAMSALTRTCIGTAGNTVPLVTDWLQAEVGRRIGGELHITGDVDIALDAAFPNHPGVLVLAGTGSNVAGRNADGRVQTAGGWGPALADQGSGHRIGHQALRKVTLAVDAGRANTLYDAICGFWQLESFDHLVAFANAAPPPDSSRLVPLVLDCAEQGDALAQEVLREQGEELAEVVLLLLQRLNAQQASATLPPHLAFAGSIMENVAPVRRALVEAVRRVYPQAEELPGVVDPAAGALWRARSGNGFGK